MILIEGSNIYIIETSSNANSIFKLHDSSNRTIAIANSLNRINRVRYNESKATSS